MKRASIAACIALFTACDEAPPPEEKVLTISEFPLAPGQPVAIAPASGSAAITALGPAGRSDPLATLSTRKEAVVKLLEGGEPSTLLPVVDADPGETFDYRRRFQLSFPAPKKTADDGQLPAEVIRRVVRQSSGTTKRCYEAALRDRPGLAGKVTISFRIARDGSVGMIKASKSELPATTVSCIVKAFSGLSFPASDKGSQSVEYPLTFTPQ